MLLLDLHLFITDSVKYAKRIQQALLQSEEHISSNVPPHFILFKPKDIVSGDFYWIKKVGTKSIFIGADSTGHGVPGAFMSMLGIGFLNEVVAEGREVNSAKILNKLRSKIINALEQKGGTQQKDGMDMALCKLNLKTRTLEYAGANNPLVHISEGKLSYIKGNSQPVGLSVIDNKPFTNHKIKLKKGDMIYVYSDGYQDQFGGTKGKKYMVKKFKTFLTEISNLPIEEQRVKIQEEFYDWKAKHEQVDDILVIGVKI